MSAADEATPAPRPGKRASAFRTIGEVAEDLDVPAHVLRFWESKFPQLKPMKRGGGRRYYRPDDIALLRRISDLLYIQGYTIKGVQRLLREGGGKLSDDIPPPAPGERATEHQGEAFEPELPIPGLATRPAESRRSDIRQGIAPGQSEEADRLRAVLRRVLAELEALRALLP